MILHVYFYSLVTCKLQRYFIYIYFCFLYISDTSFILNLLLTLQWYFIYIYFIYFSDTLFILLFTSFTSVILHFLFLVSLPNTRQECTGPGIISLRLLNYVVVNRPQVSHIWRNVQPLSCWGSTNSLISSQFTFETVFTWQRCGFSYIQ